jgi:hypothetical protein
VIENAARFRSVKYAILMYAARRHTRAMSESELEVIARKHAQLRDELTASSELAGGAGLVLPDETTALRLSAEERSRTCRTMSRVAALTATHCWAGV